MDRSASCYCQNWDCVQRHLRTASGFRVLYMGRQSKLFPNKGIHVRIIYSSYDWTIQWQWLSQSGRNDGIISTTNSFISNFMYYIITESLFCNILFPALLQLRNRGVRRKYVRLLPQQRPITAASITWMFTRALRRGQASVAPGSLTMVRCSRTRKSLSVPSKPEIGRVIFRDFMKVD